MEYVCDDWIIKHVTRLLFGYLVSLMSVFFEEREGPVMSNYIEMVNAWDVTWTEARRALSALDYMPLVCCGRAEHWVRHNRRVILHIDCEEEQCDSVTDPGVKLKSCRYVSFVRLAGGELLPIV